MKRCAIRVLHFVFKRTLPYRYWAAWLAWREAFEDEHRKDEPTTADRPATPPSSATGMKADASRLWAMPKHADDLVIREATWGIDTRQMDVTVSLQHQLADAMRLGHALPLDLMITNQLFGHDPAVGVGKWLSVRYLWRGREYQLDYPEGKIARIPFVA